MKNSKVNSISADYLKWFALITMFIDHTGAVLLEGVFLPASEGSFHQILEVTDTLMRAIGRLAFPVFAYFICQGFIHTRSVVKYAVRLFLFALLSEIPFDLAVFGKISNAYSSVYVTLLVGLLGIWGIDYVKKYSKALAVPVFLAAAAAAELLHSDYGYKGVILIVLFYLCKDKNKPEEKYLLPILGFLASYALMIPLYGYSALSVFNWAAAEACCLLSYYLLSQCNGIRKNKKGKYFFYAFYPLHLLFLYGIGRLFV